MTDFKKTRVLVVCSAGGHLMEAMLAIEGLDVDFDVATFRLSHLKTPPGSAKGLHFLIDPHVSIFKYAVNALQSIGLLMKVRPRVILTTGAGIAIPCALFGKLYGARLIVVESAARVKELSRTGLFLYKYADLFIVQWPDLCNKYPKAVYGGCVL